MLALPPDGQTIVYRATWDGTFQLFRRPIDQFEATPMPGKENGVAPFFSPDGQWVGFSAGGVLLKVSLAGGPAQMLTALPSGLRGADWGADDIIVLGLNQGLMRTTGSGAEPTPLFTPDNGRRSWYPRVLPEGDTVLFTLSDQAPDTGELHLVMPETGEHRTLVPNAVAGRVLDTGHLVFVRSSALWSVPFDHNRSSRLLRTNGRRSCRLMGGGLHIPRTRRARTKSTCSGSRSSKAGDQSPLAAGAVPIGRPTAESFSIFVSRPVRDGMPSCA